VRAAARRGRTLGEHLGPISRSGGIPEQFVPGFHTSALDVLPMRRMSTGIALAAAMVAASGTAAASLTDTCGKPGREELTFAAGRQSAAHGLQL
jgi:hypothetical protein